MIIQKSISLKPYNTFSIDVKADFYIELSSPRAIEEFVRTRIQDYPKFILLGGGSNVLFLNDFKGLVIALRNKGIQIIDKGNNIYWVTVQAGESWSYLVDYCTDRGLAGLQNLALIPGNAGSSPIQNIGAYGSELKDVFHHLDGIFIHSGQTASFSSGECNFGYRNSIFKNELKGKFLITSITLELKKKQSAEITYKGLIEELAKSGIIEPSISDIRDIIKNIRMAKLPDPELLGNAGSFFKNPVVSVSHFGEIVKEYPDVIAFPQPDGNVKLAAGWLIEKCGWKGKRIGDAGVHEKQALVLINYGHARGNDILNLAGDIKKSIHNSFGVDLELEVNVIE